jgi:ribosome-binding protein aMBF1 (putative translation factor)
MKTCMRCGKTEEEIRLFDGIYVAEPVKICEKCSLMAGIPIIKRPDPVQIRNSEKPAGVRERLMRMNHLSVDNYSERTISDEIKRLEQMPQLQRPEHIKVSLVDNFHWVIKTERRRRGYMLKQLADAIGESSSALESLEKGIVPEKSIELVRKLEKFFNMRLFKKQPEEVIQAETVVLRTPDWVKRAEEKKEYEKRMREEEGNDMVREAILEERDPIILDKEEINGRPMSVMNFKKAKDSNPNILELRRVQRLVEQDSPKKTAFETGEEQMSGFGNEDTDRLKKIVYKEEEKKSKNSTPTIYDLMKKKEDRERDKFE